MKIYGNTCPLCCGDLDGATVCRSCQSRSTRSRVTFAPRKDAQPWRFTSVGGSTPRLIRDDETS